MQDDELRQLIKAIQTSRAMPDAERELFLEERLSALLKARYSGADVSLTDESIRSNMARLVAAVETRGATASKSGSLSDTRRVFPHPYFYTSGQYAAGTVAIVIMLMFFVAIMREMGGDRFSGMQRSTNRADLLPAPATQAVQLVRAPRGAEVPEGFVDPTGTLHLTYGHEDNGFYIQSRDGGSTFSQPIQLNRGGCGTGTVAVGGERGPKLSIGRDGILHVVWLVQGPNHAGVWYARSRDGGRSFDAERNLLDAQTACDSPTVSSDLDGNVWVFWLDGRLPADPKSPLASPIFMTRSTDNGQTFSANERVRHDYPGLACACCRLEARVGLDDFLYLSFRSGYQNVRDAYLLKGRKSENDFKAVRVSPDNWTFHG